MKHEFAQFRIVAVTSLILLLALAACSQSPGGQSVTPPANDGQPAVAASPEQPTLEQPTQAPAEVTIGASDPCSVFTKEQVEAAFGKSVQEVKADQKQDTGKSSCKYVFGKNNGFGITFIEGEKAVNYGAIEITLMQKEGCSALLSDKNVFPNEIPPLKEKFPDADESLLQLSLGNLYRQQFELLSPCAYVHIQDRSDLGANVIAVEQTFFLGTSEVAILGDKKVVNFAYGEQLPQDVTDEWFAHPQGGDFPLAKAYAETVLSGYTEIVVGLVKQVIGK